MLFQIRDYVQRERWVSSQQIAREFQLDEHALQPMLDCCVRKGWIQPTTQSASCASPCSKCKTNGTVFYHWVVS